MTAILIVDDVPAMREQYAYDLERLGGFQILTAADGREALEILQHEPVDCMILDLEMPGLDGFEVLQALRERKARVPVIVYTGTGDFDRCVRAIKLGAYSFIDKAEPTERIFQEVQNALERGRLKREVSDLRRVSAVDTPLIGSSDAMERLRAEIAKIAPIPSSVLIIGESGSGKELVAREIHEKSGRDGQPFVAVNCAALPDNLVESELFGHERGAFTGAVKTRKGAFESAGQGTLFLDEIGELPMPVQAKLLRVLEEQTVSRLGSSKMIKLDARVVAATHRDLDSDVRDGRFRQDLLYRLNVHVLQVPSLREHLEDISELVGHLMRGICERFGIRAKSVSEEALLALSSYDWRRNNVRELRNVVERMIIASGEDPIERLHVPVEILRSRGARDDGVIDFRRHPGEAGKDGPDPGSDQTEPVSFRALRSDAEKRIVLEALDRNDWHITRTAKALGLADHSSLIKIMKRHGLKRQLDP